MSRFVGYTKFDRGLAEELQKMLDRDAPEGEAARAYDELKRRLGRETVATPEEPSTDRPSGLPRV